jgi:hypothetical protein
MMIQKPKIVAQSTTAFVSQGMNNILLVVMQFCMEPLSNNSPSKCESR